MATELTLNILGTSFSIMADEDEAYLREILAQYSTAVENTQAISGITNALNVAVLTGFLLCDEINRMKLSMEGESQEVEMRTLNLIAKLDEAIPDREEEFTTNHTNEHEQKREDG
jgi:cell division protein ZapA (FtsZ GTPase activity inhibitor)